MDAAALQRKRRERAVFHELLDLPRGAREARLDDYARDDPALAQALRATLAAADEDVVADVAAGERPDAGEPPAVERSPTVVSGRFRLLRLLGIGGMGEVYLAERIDDVQQRVALKLVRDDLPISHARARRERQILARLNHAHIAGLIDTGIAKTGQPWFAMEYVEGERITDWCDRRRLDLRVRARLLARVCAAVQFAHRNLVLHRDLKPSNILVDAEGAPKLLDFGIAKLLDATDEQETRTLALTLAYAAPEQLRGEAATTSSDVYQLGLILYELACGVTARGAHALVQQTGTAALPRPGQVLAALVARDRQELDRLAQLRATRPDRLRRQLGGDFARVLAKATDDDPRARYATAQALADDLERWADGLPVTAHRGSLAYRLRKLVRRHALATSAIFLLSLGMIATTFLALDQAHRERQQRSRAEQQQRAAERQQQLAEQQRLHAETLLGFLRDVFREGDPDHAQGAVLSAVDLLGRASAKLDQRTDLGEDARAVLLAEIADVFNKLGQTQRALGPAQRAQALLLPQRDRYPGDYLKNISTLADVHLGLSRYQDAADVIETALPLAQQTVDAQRHWHADLLQLHAYALLRLGRAAEAVAETGTVLAELDESGGKNSQSLVDTLNIAATVFIDSGETRQADALYRRLDAIIEANPTLEQSGVLQAASRKGVAEYARGDANAAATILAPLVPRFVNVLGPAHFNTLNARVWLALSYLAQGNYASAGSEVDAIDAALSTRPALDLQTQLMTGALEAKYLLCTGRTVEADALIRQLMDLSRSNVQSRNTWLSLNGLLAEVLLQQRRFRDAIDLLQPMLREQEGSDGSKLHWTIAVREDSLGRAYLLQGDWPRSRAHLQRAIAAFSESQGADKPSTLRSEIHLLWAQALSTHDPTALDRLAGKRTELAAALGGDAKPQLWQLDLLIDDLARKFGRPGIDSAQRERALAGLAQLRGGRPAGPFVGLNRF
jgi:serine/threonine-protein kinase